MLYETEAAASFHGLCHFFGRLSKASRAGMKAALRGCPKCHFPMLDRCGEHVLLLDMQTELSGTARNVLR